MGHGEGGGDGMISVSSHILCVGRQGQVFPSGMGRKTEVVAACAAGWNFLRENVSVQCAAW